MKKIALDEKFLVFANENKSKSFFAAFIGYSLLLFFVLSILGVILSPFLGADVIDNFVQNMWIRILLWMMTATISSSFLWLSYGELIKFPDKSNVKAMWFQILSLGIFGFGFYLPMFNIDYVGDTFGQIIGHHLFYMITLGLLGGYLSWDGKDFERIKEIVGEPNRIL